jgi:hypothetical protein
MNVKSAALLLEVLPWRLGIVIAVLASINATPVAGWRFLLAIFGE